MNIFWVQRKVLDLIPKNLHKCNWPMIYTNSIISDKIKRSSLTVKLDFQNSTF